MQDDTNEAVEQTQTEEGNVPVSNAGLTMAAPEQGSTDPEPEADDTTPEVTETPDPDGENPDVDDIEAAGEEDDEITLRIKALPSNGMPLRVNGKVLCKCLRVGDEPTLSSAGVLALSNIDGVDFEYI